MNKQDVQEGDSLVQNFENRPSSTDTSYCHCCQRKLSNENFSFHKKYKCENYGAQFIAKEKLLENDILLCPAIGCCFSTNKINNFNEHFKSFKTHKILTPTSVLIMDRSVTMAKCDSELLQCAKCSKRFSCRKNLLRHSNFCRGRGLVSCDVCRAVFTSFDELFVHIEGNHKVRKAFFRLIKIFFLLKMDNRHFMELNKFKGLEHFYNSFLYLIFSCEATL